MNQQPPRKKPRNPYERRIGRLLLLLFSLIGISVFFLGVNPRLFGYEFENLAISRLLTWTLAPALIGIGIGCRDICQPGIAILTKLSWWRVLIYGYSTGTIFGILLSALPEFSFRLYLISLIWMLVVTLCILLTKRREMLLLRLIVVSYLPNIFFIIGTRLWIGLIGFHWGWFMTFLGCYIFSWSVPKLLPRVSTFLFREQFFPTTPLGKIMFRLAFLLMPIAGTGGLIGMYMHRYLGDRISFLILAILCTGISIAVAQPFSHQLFHKKPFENLSAGNVS